MRGSALVSTVDDLWAFASMLAADCGGLLSAESVRLMTRDRMTAAERVRGHRRLNPQLRPGLPATGSPGYV